MEVVSIVLITLIAILIVAIIFLIVKLAKKMTDEERKVFLDKCLAAVKVVIAALADGKITTDELKQILKALVEIIACFNNKSYRNTVDELGAAPYLNDAANEEIIVERST